MLTILVTSFSYKRGIPTDPSGNGGGFVFDCRGILNPGRLEEYSKLTGRDQEVQDFLITKTEFPDFMELAEKIVSINVKDYIRREFDHLMISFGCTGGQHRSVFAADTMATFLNDNFKVNVNVLHIEQESKNWINQ